MIADDDRRDCSPHLPQSCTLPHNTSLFVRCSGSRFPAVIVYLGHWFIQEDRAKATSNFMAAIPVSLVIGSPVAGWILSHNWFAIEGWRWLFLLEGIPAILLGTLAFFFLTDRPRRLANCRATAVSQKLNEKPSSRQLIVSVRHSVLALCSCSPPQPFLNTSLDTV
jgi:MFS family permease